MCSNNEEEQNEMILMETIEIDNMIGKMCKKCDVPNEAKIVLRKKDAYCKECFLSSVTHKFRACLGKSRKMRPGDRVLLGVSGDTNSVALLHLITKGIQDSSHKKLMIHPLVLFIDETSAFDLTSDERIQTIYNIDSLLHEYKYPSYRIPIDLCMQAEEDVDAYLAGEKVQIKEGSVKKVLETLQSITAKADILSKLRYNLLAQAAKSLECQKVFTTESADDLAIKLMTNISLGRGGQLPYDVGFLDDRFQDIKIVRPLRDLSKKELAFYNIFNSLKSTYTPSLTTKVEPLSSIQKLTEKFLCDLQNDFPSTLSTVFRVADKLTTNPANQIICLLCKAPLDSDEDGCSSLSATRFSQLVSLSGPSNSEKVEGSSCCDGASIVKCGCNSESSRRGTSELCYGCNLILKDSDTNSFPMELMQQLQVSHQRSKMKKEIEEFLL